MLSLRNRKFLKLNGVKLYEIYKWEWIVVCLDEHSDDVDESERRQTAESDEHTKIPDVI